MISNAFTCTGAYAVLILTGIKRVENRSAMPTPAKGRCAVSCSKSFCAAEFGRLVAWAAENLPPEDFAALPAWADVKDWPGKIVGTCDYEAKTADEARGGASFAWNEGYPCWWTLSEVVSFDVPVPCRGNVGMWTMPPELAGRVTAADRLARSVGQRIASADDAARLFRAALPVVGRSEGFFVLPLDDGRHALAPPTLVSLGTDAATTAVQPGEVFRAALKAGASAVVVAHNHPSGDLTPSAQDRRLTEALVRLGDALQVRVLDHLILSDNECKSILKGERT